MIGYNHALEFTCSMLKYCKQKKLYPHWYSGELKQDPARGLLDFTPNVKIKEWLSYIDENISPYFKNDFLFVNTSILGFLDVCFLAVLEEALHEPQELIEYIKDIDENALVRSIFSYYDCSIDYDSPDSELLDALTQANSKEVASNFMYIKKNPLEYKTRVIDSLEEFYKLFYAPFEEEVYGLMKLHLENHNKSFENDPVSFVNLIGSGDYSSRVKSVDDIDLYVSYYIDAGMFYYNIDDRIIMCYGKTIRDRFSHEKDIESYKSLFKALSDDKRIEILKITSKRPWYNKELATYFNLTTATLSYHLNLLLDLGVLNFEPSIINNRYYYTANTERLKQIFDIALDDLLK